MPEHATLTASCCTDLIRELGAAAGRMRRDEPMHLHTSFKVGGPADLYFEPASNEEMIIAASLCQRYGIPCTVLGNGTNVLVADKGIRGLVMVIGEPLAGIRIDGSNLVVKAGTRLSAVAAQAARLSLAGLEFASGIPGTLGGAVQMNAGAYDGCMQDVVTETLYLDESLHLNRMTGGDHQFAYRESTFTGRNVIILESRLQLREGHADTILARMAELSARRRQSQPLDLPSAGSVFKRPAGHYAGKLISDSGLKGQMIGSAQVSEKHAGFIVNRGDATACDILALLQRVQRVVFADTGVWLEPEIKIIGDWQDVQLQDYARTQA